MLEPVTWLFSFGEQVLSGFDLIENCVLFHTAAAEEKKMEQDC